MNKYFIYNDDLTEILILERNNPPEEYDNFFELSEDLEKQLIKEVNKLK